MNTNKTIDEICSEVKGFILDNYLYGYEEEELDNDVSILDMGVIDSTGIIELVLFIEEGYHFEVSDHEIIPENLDSINRISKYIFSKLEAEACA
jgi:acyl carrier protein